MLQLKAAYISRTPLANYLDPQNDPKMLWFGSTPGRDFPLGSHDSNEAYLETDHSLQPAICFLHQHTLAGNIVRLVYQQRCRALMFLCNDYSSVDILHLILSESSLKMKTKGIPFEVDWRYSVEPYQ